MGHEFGSTGLRQPGESVRLNADLSTHTHDQRGHAAHDVPMHDRDEFSEETRHAVIQLRRAGWILPVLIVLGVLLLAL